MSDEEVTQVHELDGWTVRVKFDTHWMDFDCFRRFDMGDGDVYYADDDFECTSRTTTDVNEAVPSFSGFIKWDACYQITSINDMPLHWDVAGDLNQFCAMLQHLPVLAKQMESWDNAWDI